MKYMEILIKDGVVTTEKRIIHLCPRCKEYLGGHYAYCCYCGITLMDKELIVVDIDKNTDDELLKKDNETAD